MSVAEPTVEEKYEMAKELADYWLGRFVEMRNEFSSLQIRHSELAEHHNKHCKCGQLR